MDDVAFVRARIESYADYTNGDVARRLSDEQVRAYVGEALSRAGERLGPTATGSAAFGDTLWRCEFADQHVLHALDLADFQATDAGALHRYDRELVELADRADHVEQADLAALLTSIDATFDARSAAIRAAVPPERRLRR